MTSSTQNKSIYTRRILWLSIAAVAIGLIYTGVWFYSARLLDERMQTTLARLNGDGVRANCEEPRVHGYPFRLGVQCRSVFFEDIKEGVSFRAGAIETAAAIYDPMHVVMSVESPATVFLPFIAPVDLRWDKLNVSAQLASPLPSRVSTAGTNISIFPNEDGSNSVATLSAATLHARQVDADVEVAATFNDLMLNFDAIDNMPPLEGRAFIVATDGVGMLAARNLNLRGRSGQIEELVIGVAGQKASISLTGPVAFDNDGYLTAQLTFKAEDPVGTAKVLADVFPAAANHIRSATGMLTALGNASLEIRIVRGAASLGFIPLGRIPPI